MNSMSALWMVWLPWPDRWLAPTIPDRLIHFGSFSDKMRIVIARLNVLYSLKSGRTERDKHGDVMLASVVRSNKFMHVLAGCTSSFRNLYKPHIPMCQADLGRPQ
jgi:hypothetical protein